MAASEAFITPTVCSHRGARGKPSTTRRMRWVSASTITARAAPKGMGWPKNSCHWARGEHAEGPGLQVHRRGRHAAGLEDGGPGVVADGPVA